MHFIRIAVEDERRGGTRLEGLNEISMRRNSEKRMRKKKKRTMRRSESIECSRKSDTCFQFKSHGCVMCHMREQVF